MSAEIFIHPRSRESAGAMLRRFASLGYSLSDHRGRIVARRTVPVLTNVVSLPRRSKVNEIFDWRLPENAR